MDGDGGARGSRRSFQSPRRGMAVSGRSARLCGRYMVRDGPRLRVVLRAGVDQGMSRLAVLLVLACSPPAHAAWGQGATCPPLDSTAAWARVNHAWSVETGVRWSNDSLRHVLLHLAEQDQALRADFGARINDSLYVRQLMRQDSSLAATMRVILDRFGLPTRDLVGPAGSDAAMLIVQHNWPLQEEVLARAKALPPDQVSPERLGMLEDRVLVHRGRAQRLGTQFTVGANGVFRLEPILDTVGLDARRAHVGMPPMRQYVCLLAEEGMRIDRASLPPAFRP